MQPLRWYLNRLRAMSVPELVMRGRRQARHTLERSGLLRADRPPPPRLWPPPGESQWSRAKTAADAACVASAERILEGSFELFGERFDMPGEPQWNVDPEAGVRAPLRFGKTLDYRDTRLVGNIKYLWELNRHLELVALAQAYALTGRREFTDKLGSLLSSWLEQCPYPRGPNWCSSLELAIRLINWHLAYRIVGGAQSPLFAGPEGREFGRRWLDAIYQHVHFIMGHLSTHSSANNHRIGELAGVYVAASTWPCWREMELWRERARAALCREVETQTHDDGVNKEQALWYQQFVMYFLLIAGLAGERGRAPFPATYWQALCRMTTFLDAVMDVEGRLPMIGDADDGIVFALEPKDRFDPFRSLLAIGAALFGVAHWERRAAGHDATARWLCAGLGPVLEPEPVALERRAFPSGGYYVLGSGLGTADEIRIVADAGPLGFLSIAAHGHADCLAFTLSAAGRELLVDPGTFCYHTQREWRDYFRSTAAHNTVRIDGVDQSRIAGPFLWADKAVAVAEEFRSSETVDYLRARHLGYRSLADPVTHTRAIELDKRERKIEVVDEIECAGGHSIERYWHFAEHCNVTLTERGLVAVSGGVSLTLEVAEEDARGSLRHGELDPMSGWISRRFGAKQPTTTVVFANDLEGSRTLRTSLKLRLSAD